MRAERANHISGKVLIVLSVIALLTVLTGYLQPPHTPAAKDEGAAAHIFQLSIMLAAMTLLLFLATADWTEPGRSMRALAIPAVAVVLAFSALYYLEHYYLGP